MEVRDGGSGCEVTCDGTFDPSEAVHGSLRFDAVLCLVCRAMAGFPLSDAKSDDLRVMYRN